MSYRVIKLLTLDFLIIFVASVTFLSTIFLFAGGYVWFLEAIIVFGGLLALYFLLRICCSFSKALLNQWLFFCLGFLLWLGIDFINNFLWLPPVFLSVVIAIKYISLLLAVTALWTANHQLIKGSNSLRFLLVGCLAAIAIFAILVYGSLWPPLYFDLFFIGTILVINIIWHSFTVFRGPCLRMLNGPVTGSVVIINRDVFNIGSQSNCNLCLSDYYLVEPVHCKIVRYKTPLTYLIVSHSMSNQLYLNYRKVEDQILEDGDIISVGHAKMQFFLNND